MDMLSHRTGLDGDVINAFLQWFFKSVSIQIQLSLSVYFGDVLIQIQLSLSAFLIMYTTLLNSILSTEEW